MTLRVPNEYLPDLLKEIASWSEQTFPEETVEGKLTHLQEEVVELLENTDDEGEWADCFLLLFDAARKKGYSFNDITNYILTKYEKNMTRTWQQDAPGVYHHVKDVDVS